MAREFVVFPASVGDGDAVGEIHAEAWKAAYAGFFAPEFFAEAVKRRRHRWHGVLAEGKQTVLLAVLDGRPLAYSCFGFSPGAPKAGFSPEAPEAPDSAELFGFYGHPDSWGSGVASVLMTASLQRMQEDGFGRVHLWTLRDTPQSRRFYAKSGFAESGATRGHDFGDGHPIEQVEYEQALR